MLQDTINKVLVLTLEDTDTLPLLNYYNIFFEKNMIEFYRVPNEKSKRPINEGHLDTRFWDIICHRSLDEISQAITKNHISMIRYALDKKYERVIFLEDDARFLHIDNMRNQELSIRKMIESGKIWDIIYMGYCPWPCLFSYFVQKNMVRLFTPLTSHAYILNTTSMMKITDFFDKHDNAVFMHIDKLFSTIPNLKKYGVFPSISFQDKDPALFVKAMDFCGLSIPFSYLSRVMEYVAISIPFIIILLIIIVAISYKAKTTFKILNPPNGLHPIQ